MISRRLLIFALAGLAGMISPLSASAHRSPVVITTISAENEGTLSITHRMHAHDAISLLSADSEMTQPEVMSLKSRAKVALYVSENFLLGIQGSAQAPVPVNVEIIGAELEGDYLYIYQEASLPSSGTSFYLRSGLLSEIGKDWLSHVNLELNGTVRTLTFSGKPAWKKAR